MARKVNVGNESTKPDSPVKKYLQWTNLTKNVKDSDGDVTSKVIGGKFFHTVKVETADETVYEKIDVPLPFQFTLLDSNWTTFKGYHEPSGMNFWSNEVDDYNSIITIRSKEGVFAEFTMSEFIDKDKAGQELREKVKAKAVKKLRSIYGVWTNEDKQLELINLQLKGTQDYVATDKTAGWASFIKKNVEAVSNYDIVVRDAIIAQKDKNSPKYTYPIWELSKKPTDLNNEDAFNAFYAILTEYHKKYKVYIKSLLKEVVEVDEEQKETPVKQSKKQPVATEHNDGDDGDDDGELPF